MTSINQARLKAIGQSYIKPTGWYSAHSLAEHATVNSFELWIKVSVGDDRLISDLATISATIRHITSVSVVQVLTSDHWSLSAIERVILSTKKKRATRICGEDVFCAWKTWEEDQPCTPIHSIANTARFVRCWIVYWIPRRNLSGDPRVSAALAVLIAWRVIMELSDDATLWHIVIEVIFYGAGSNLFFSCQECKSSAILALLLHS